MNNNNRERKSADAGSTDQGPKKAAPRVLILFAHPALEKSRVNRRLIAAVQDLPGVTFHDLYEAYPDFHIYVEEEQELLNAHEIVVMQHPFFWYSTPSLIKEWEDLVLQHGWAYGSQGTALQGKTMVSVLTTGGREPAYGPKGMNRFTVRQLLAPIEQTAVLCGMRYLPPFVVHGSLGMNPETIDAHAADYRKLIEALRDNTLDVDAAWDLPRLNVDLEALLLDGGKSHAR